MTNCKCVHLVTGNYFQSRKKDGRHANRSAVAENHMLHAHFTTLCYRHGATDDGTFTTWGSGFVLACRFPLQE